MKIAVTGATGFIGRHIIAELSQHVVETIAVVRNVAKIPAEWECDICTLDISEAGEGALASIGSPDAVIHLAWGGLPNYNSMHHIETELPCQYHFLSQLVKEGLQTLIVAGTCLEYGMQYGSLSEGLEARPTTPYGYAKNALRTQLEYLRKAHSFNFTWSRLFYLYGEGQPPNTIYSQLREAVRQGKQRFDMSGGEQLRDYLPVEKAASLLINLALKEADAGILNIASGRPISIRSLVERWIHENEWKIEPNLGSYPYPTYEPMAFWGDATKLMHHLRSTKDFSMSHEISINNGGVKDESTNKASH